MKKWMKMYGLFLFTLPIALQAEDYTCTTNSGKITITKYIGSGGAVTVPGVINSLPVTAIANYGFSNCSNVTSVTINDSVISFGTFVFRNCTNLTSVILPANITRLELATFQFCKKLNNVTIPSGVTSIGNFAFEGCGITNLVIPGNVTNIGMSAFYDCTNLIGVYFLGNAPFSGGSLFSGDTQKPVIYHKFDATGWPPVPEIWADRPTALWGHGASYLLSVTGGSGSGSYTNGEQVTITAEPVAGKAFFKWLGATQHVAGVASSTAVVTMPATNISLTASNVVDTTKPTVTITAPKAAQRILSNATYTVTGTAADNKVVTNVMVKLNESVYTPAVTTNGWKDWSAQVQLVAGSNTVRAYSTDSAFNNSTTSTVACTYVVLGNLTIQTNGAGTVTRAPTGAPEVGKTYMLTAAAGAGSVFSNWTGAVNNPTNKVTAFTMTSNMTIRANFTDIAKPTVAITAPTALQRIVTNGLIAVRGTATDNKAVSNVLVQVNGGSWTDAATTNGWKNWNAEVTVSARTNTVRAYSMDTTGNCSTTSSVTFVYVEMGNLAIQTNGLGSVTRTPATTPELGVKYTMTATPKAGSVFTNWTYGIGGDVATNKPAVTFTMPSNLVLTANFTDIAKPTVTITLPTANLRITNTNPVYTVKGAATDNSSVATVKVRLNSGDWTNAVTTNAWKNWSVPVTLITGTNTVRAYSIDTTGNNSSTATVACIYPVVTIDVAAYANLSVGGRWNYKQTEGRDIETRALEVIEITVKNSNTVYLLQEYSDGGYPDDQFFWSSDFSAGLFDTGGLNDNGEPTETTFYWQPFMPKLLKTFVPGTEITTKCTRSDMTGFITGKGKTVRERVTVPAGTYDCWKVSGTSTFNGQVSSDTSWYAENVGLVKRLQDGSLWELTSYVPPASSDQTKISSSGQDVVSVPTLPAAITVDGSSKDWTGIPRSAFSYASTTQEVAVALGGNNIALLLNGCPFSTSDTVLVYFKLRLTYGEGDNRHTVDLWTSGSVLYGMVDGQVITGLEAVLLNGVLEVKIPVEQVPTQVIIEEVGCGMDPGNGMMTELFKFSP